MNIGKINQKTLLGKFFDKADLYAVDAVIIGDKSKMQKTLKVVKSTNLNLAFAFV